MSDVNEEATSRRGRGRGGRGRGKRTSGKSRSRGRGKKRATPVTDKERVKAVWEQRREKMKVLVKEMSREALENMVVQLIEREPGMVFDLCEAAGGDKSPTPGPSGTSPSWCRCGNCRQMGTTLEDKCCGCLPANCIAHRDHFDRLVLDPEVLMISQRYYREMLGRYRQSIDDQNKVYRHTAYRNFTLWRHGRLGAGVRRVIPSCCVWRIREIYPSATGQYTGFVPSRYI